MKEINYLVSVFVGGKCADLFYSENLCELHVCRALHKGCEIEVYDMRSFRQMPKKEVKRKECETTLWTEKKRIPDQVVCLNTKKIYSSLDECARDNGLSRVELMDTITGMTVINGQRFCFAQYIIGKEKGK